MTDPTKPSNELDPFFSIPDDRTWNACIGPQGDEENYVEGYILAALELATLVIERHMYIGRDTLVFPILYNARHGVELALKFFIKRLHEVGVIAAIHPVNHDIESHWNYLCSTKIGDETIRGFLSQLAPYITSLASVDEDGQQLRYSEDRDGQTSLKDKPLANLEVIRDSLTDLKSLLERIKHRVLDFCREVCTGTFIPECSRKDLIEIARMLPPRGDWKTESFTQAKNEIKERFALSGKKFSAVLTIIEGNREMRQLLDLDSQLMHLTDAHVKFVIEQWSICHPPRPSGGDLGLDYFSGRDLKLFQQGYARSALVCQELLQKLSHEELADLETIYYFGRDGKYSEDYERKLGYTKREYAVADNLLTKVDHLRSKTNLLKCLSRGIRLLGRPTLADELLAMRPDL